MEKPIIVAAGSTITGLYWSQVSACMICILVIDNIDIPKHENSLTALGAISEAIERPTTM